MMKILYTLLITLFFIGGAVGQSCLPDGITFETQAQIDSFQINYPGCTEIEGSVNVWSSEVSNFDSLYSIQSIMGGLHLDHASQLEDFSGLENLEYIGGYLAVNQSSINNFNGLNNLNVIAGTFTCQNNPNLTSFEGLNELQIIRSLTFLVDNKRVKDLSGLENLEYIGERFIIRDNDSLFTLSGLNKLVTIDSGLYISNNHQLQSLTGLNNLTSIGGELWISETSLIDLTGLNNLTTIEGYLGLVSNDLLKSLNGLEKLESIGGLTTGFTVNFTWPTFTGNPNLESIEALANLTYIGGNMSICGTSLKNLYGLESLTTVVGDIEIGRTDNGPYWDGNNPFLENIDAIRNITSIGGKLSIVANDTLADCAIESICAYLSDPVDTVEIFGNNLGCNSPEEVQDSCEAHAGIIDGIPLASGLSIYPNPSSSSLSIELQTQPSKNTMLMLSSTNGQQLITQPITEPQTEIDISQLPNGIYIVKVWNDKDVMVRKVMKQ